jgi:RNA polymerase sigma-70 factor (ECF subfamily)
MSRRTTTPAERLELANLIARAQTGESAAQTELVRRYTSRIAAFVRPIICQPSAVDDVVQLVFIKTLRQLKVLSETAAFESWLFTLARNTAVDFIRRRRCRPVTVSDEFEIAAVPDTDSTRREAEIMEALELALRQLQPRDRSIVSMIVRGNSYRTAAEREGLSIGAVKLRLNRVRPFLRMSVGEALGVSARNQQYPRVPRCRLAA